MHERLNECIKCNLTVWSFLFERSSQIFKCKLLYKLLIDFFVIKIFVYLSELYYKRNLSKKRKKGDTL